MPGLAPFKLTRSRPKPTATLMTGSSEGTISMAEGEDLSLMEEDKGDGWTRVRRKQGGEGYVPTSYLRVTLN